ncbi:hypothetical protein GQ42DRAFT_160189, partial [Ramicandelaber brevisporus]
MEMEMNYTLLFSNDKAEVYILNEGCEEDIQFIRNTFYGLKNKSLLVIDQESNILFHMSHEVPNKACATKMRYDPVMD